jgi:hypothetical protein
MGQACASDAAFGVKADEWGCVAQELNAPEFMPKLVELGFSVMFDCIKEKEQVGLIDLLIKLAKEGTISKEHLCEGLKTQVGSLSLSIIVA